MEKFLKIEGLNLLCDPKKLKPKSRNIEKKAGKSNLKFIDQSYLDSFKEFIKNKIDNFNPIVNKDNFDVILISLWHQYIFSNVDNSKYYEFVKILNKKVENPDVNIENDDIKLLSDNNIEKATDEVISSP